MPAMFSQKSGNQQPRSLSVAFLRPITGCDYGTDSIKALTTQLNNMDAVYGKCADSRFFINALSGCGGIYLVQHDKSDMSSDPQQESVNPADKDQPPLFGQLLDFVST
jgi:hypothetical protein